MRRIALIAALGAAAVGVGVGTYLALRGPAVPQVPKARRSVILEHAKAEGVIGGYRVESLPRWHGARIYTVGHGEIVFNSYASSCGGPAPGPACLWTPPLMVIEYRHGVAAQAHAIGRIAHGFLPKSKIRFFETTTLGG